MNAVLRTTSPLAAELMSLPAFVEEAMLNMPLGKFIAAHLAPDPIQADRELDALVAAYLADWLTDHRRSAANKTGYIGEEQALRDGIDMFTETARKWPIGLVRP